MKNIALLTGGAGHIGSHTFVALVEAGYQPVLVDDFSNSDPAVLSRLEMLTGQSVICERGDVLDVGFIANVLQRHKCIAAVHFADLKAVGESVEQPLCYYRTNVGGLISLLKATETTACRALAFSSCATVHGDPASVPIKEDFPNAPESPYGRTRLMRAEIQASLQISDAPLRIGVLRNFNPVDTHPSELTGESLSGVPNNFTPFVNQVAVGKREKLCIFGNDYASPDWTGVRDYLDVVDLAEVHVAAVRALVEKNISFTVNLGTGQGTSVLKVTQDFEKLSRRKVNHDYVPRRPGDVAQYFTNVSLTSEVLGWRATKTIEDMCRDSWDWQQNNPDGCRTAAPADAVELSPV